MMSTPSPGTLFLVPNTLDHGTLGDGPPPDLRLVLPAAVLDRAAGLKHWVVENARSARAFLKRVDALSPLAEPLQALDIRELPRPPKGRSASNEGPALLAELLAPLRAGRDLGLLSEAGLPAVADPGSALVAAAHQEGLPVRALSGPSSLMLALANSGLEGQRFAFAGYVDTEAGARTRQLQAMERRSREEGQTQILIETPYRNTALAQALMATLSPATRLSISVGLTLEAGWTRTRTVGQWRRQPPEMPKDIPAVFLFLA